MAGAGSRPLLIVTDASYHSDDSIAILMLLKSPAVTVTGIVTTSGNVWAEESATAVRALLKESGYRSTPVRVGLPVHWHADRRARYLRSERPNWTRQYYVGAFAGEPAQGDGPTKGAARSSQDGDEEATAFIAEQAQLHGGKLELILLGPATLVAEAFRRYPAIRQSISALYVMGGALDRPGNVTRWAEFNVWFDPEAMDQVLRSGVSMTLIPLDATNGVNHADEAEIPESPDRPAMNHLARYLREKGRGGEPVGMWDEVVGAIVIDPSVVVEARRLRLAVSTGEDPEYGRLRVIAGESHRPETMVPETMVNVITGVDPAGVRRVLSSTLLRN